MTESQVPVLFQLPATLHPQDLFRAKFVTRDRVEFVIYVRVEFVIHVRVEFVIRVREK